MNEKVLEKCVFDEAKLLAFGFCSQEGKFVYTEKILDRQFRLEVCIFKNGETGWEVFDEDTGEVYTLAKVFGAEGAFVGEVRLQVGEILERIVHKCGTEKVFKSLQSEQIERYVKEKYDCDFEYLWEKTPDNAVFRRQDNKKWIGAVLTVAENKIYGNLQKKIEILDFRAKPEDIEEIVDGKKYFSGYHMNKKHWVTVCLNGSVDIEEIFYRIDESYLLAKK